MASPQFPAGTAPIKAEFLVHVESRGPPPDDDAIEGATSHVKPSASDNAEEEGSGTQRLTSAQRRKLAKEEKQKQKGANKGRRWNKVHDDLNLCWRVATGSACEFGSECRFTHDIPAYLAEKPRDVHFPSASELDSIPPFLHPPASAAQGDTVANVEDATLASVDFTTTCPVFAETGYCRHGLKCRFLGGHVRRQEDGSLTIVVDEERKAQTAISSKEMNFCGPQALTLLRKKKYPRPISDVYLRELQEAEKTANKNGSSAKPDETEAETAKLANADADAVLVSALEPELPQPPMIDDQPPAINDGLVSVPDAAPAQAITADAQSDTPDVPMRFAEKKRLNWQGLSYLAPLTTVGNLPFRRLCVTLGADITCGEMGLATSFLGGSKEEWSLVRRHPSERIFGMQLAGSKPATLVPAAEAIASECAGGLDFVDLNCGCPIDLVFRAGSGSALLDAPGRLSKILTGMSRALGEIPLTVKLRTGVREGVNTAHKIMPRVRDIDVSAMTLHGRTRQQRYTKLADWDYIRQCVDAVRAREAEEDLPRIPIFGGGDCFSSQDYWARVDGTGVDGCMVARGALIKPWIFTEIKERREWDISARERLELIRQYAEFGLSHFGTDTVGVNTTRRYLCEALSFQHRYVPIGLLEALPGRINDRAPAFRGRDELETLLASERSSDWVRISEMFLGPSPERWSFTPKHKSNAYESQG